MRRRYSRMVFLIIAGILLTMAGCNGGDSPAGTNQNELLRDVSNFNRKLPDSSNQSTLTEGIGNGIILSDADGNYQAANSIFLDYDIYNGFVILANGNDYADTVDLKIIVDSKQIPFGVDGSEPIYNYNVILEENTFIKIPVTVDLTELDKEQNHKVRFVMETSSDFLPSFQDRIFYYITDFNTDLKAHLRNSKSYWDNPDALDAVALTENNRNRSGVILVDIDKNADPFNAYLIDAAPNINKELFLQMVPADHDKDIIYDIFFFVNDKQVKYSAEKDTLILQAEKGKEIDFQWDILFEIAGTYEGYFVAFPLNDNDFIYTFSSEKLSFTVH